MHVFAEYSLLAMFDTYPASKCTTQNMYTRVCVGLVVIVSLRTTLGSLKEERKKDEQFAWATISRALPELVVSFEGSARASFNFRELCPYGML